MNQYDVAVIVGSNRRESINRKLAEALVKLAPPAFKFRWIRIDDLPMYNGNLEPHRPATVRRFTAEVARADAVLVVMPEHNRSLPAVLKSAIDWGSKPMEQNIWCGKPAAIAGTSPGVIGTAVGQQHLRQILGVLGSVVMGGEAYLQFKPGLIDAASNVTDEGTRLFLRSHMERFSALVCAYCHIEATPPLSSPADALGRRIPLLTEARPEAEFWRDALTIPDGDVVALVESFGQGVLPVEAARGSEVSPVGKCA